MKTKQVNRIDYLPYPEDGDGSYMTEALKKTPEGYLKGRAIATNVGVFPYIMADGTVMYELRPPEEVFSQESLESAKGLPFTNGHPPVMVTSDNIKEYQAGFTGDEVRQDQYHISVPITITDTTAIEEAEGGKLALSMGYTADMEYTAGNWLGVRYDAIQRNIRYNHLAQVTTGRAGDMATMKMDGMNSLGVQQIEGIYKEVNSMKRITLDGYNYDVEDDNLVIAIENKVDALNKALEQAGELEKVKKELATTTAKVDQLTDDNATLREEKEALLKADHSEAIAEAVKSRLELERKADLAGVEVKGDTSDIELKKAIILAVYPNAKLDGKDEMYITARFDGALETLEESGGKMAFKGDTLTEAPVTEGKADSELAREKMIERMKNRSKEGV